MIMSDVYHLFLQDCDCTRAATPCYSGPWQWVSDAASACSMALWLQASQPKMRTLHDDAHAERASDARAPHGFIADQDGRRLAVAPAEAAGQAVAGCLRTILVLQGSACAWKCSALHAG